MTAYYLFDGGNYKRDVEDGRNRIPLTLQEAESVFFDPELASFSGTSHRTELHMNTYAENLSALAVDDQLFVGVFPDSAVYRGLWLGSYSVLAGFTVDAELVSVKEICEAYVANDGDVSAVAAFPGTPTLAYDFADGMGQATKDAAQEACLWGGEYTDFRNNDALVFENIQDPVPALLGDSLYLRLTVTAVPEELAEDTCCGKCGEGMLPYFAAGVLAEDICFDKQQISTTCNCPETLGKCGGCEDSKTDPAPEPVEGG